MPSIHVYSILSTKVPHALNPDVEALTPMDQTSCNIKNLHPDVTLIFYQ